MAWGTGLLPGLFGEWEEAKLQLQPPTADPSNGGEENGAD